MENIALENKLRDCVIKARKIKLRKLAIVIDIRHLRDKFENLMEPIFKHPMNYLDNLLGPSTRCCRDCEFARI